MKIIKQNILYYQINKQSIYVGKYAMFVVSFVIKLIPIFYNLSTMVNTWTEVIVVDIFLSTNVDN